MDGNGSSLVPRVARALADAGVAPGDALVLAVSGGPDSMVLLDALDRIRGRARVALHVAHVHHGLRGPAADRDAALVVRACAARGLPVHVARLSPAARTRGVSVEMWARDARYQALEAVRRAVGAAWVATGHTADDQAETLLLHLLRGTGPRGLAGIPAQRDSLLRPLLAVRRAEVEAYAAARRLAFRRDASNRSDAYLRNRVRRRLLPQLAREFNPRLVSSLADLARLLREDETALDAAAGVLARRAVRRDGAELTLEIAALGAAPPAVRRRVIQRAYREQAGAGSGLTRRHAAAVDALLFGPGWCRLPGGRVALRDGPVLRLGAGPPTAELESGETSLRPGAWTSWPPAGCRLRVRRVGRPPAPGRDALCQVLSPRLLSAPLRVRGWRPGDRFRPLGLGGEKKLQDFFVDAKVPRTQRRRVPLLLAGDRIAWVVGYRVAEEFRWEGGGPGCLAEVRFDR